MDHFWISQPRFAAVRLDLLDLSYGPVEMVDLPMKKW
jgi:hypothetical protein